MTIATLPGYISLKSALKFIKFSLISSNLLNKNLVEKSSQRKHRHMVEMGLSFLAHASMALKFWDEAFLIATFLINLLPSKVINFDTSIEHILGISPNYYALRIFGCAC
jgi:hypothetical protein